MMNNGNQAGKAKTGKVVTLTGVAAMLLSTGCPDRPTVLEQIKQKGELVVATDNSSTTYYEGPAGPTGFEYDLVSLFAEYLGVGLSIVTPQSFTGILPMVAQGKADMAAAGLTVSESRSDQVRFGPPYQEVTQQLVYRAGSIPPRGVRDLVDSDWNVVTGSRHADRLGGLLKEAPGIKLRINPDLESEELLALVGGKKIGYAIADSNEIALNQHFFPELRVAFDLTEPEKLAWAFPRDGDESLYKAATHFFRHIRENGQLAQIKERYYGHIRQFDYVGTRKFMRHIDRRLIRYIPYFLQAAEDDGLDWRLLAAIGYQESHWNPRAISPTGVRGIMMLTRTTAADLGIRNRLDPQNSIKGGARYFRQLWERMPLRIPEPDRTWFALAAYNLGLGHLQDARVITQRRGGDPDKWMDVKENLPLLMHKRWYRQVRHGFARGGEAVRYVENIRSYYDILVWQTGLRQAARPYPTLNEAVAKTRFTPSPIL